MSFWPLAILHSSSRNWSNLCESLGIPQPVLLPFGVPLHARKRTTTGYRSHWVSRTVLATYLGLAPNTPGGHLVWVPDEKGGYKVMLTNTVYPLGPVSSDPKPKFRIFGKTRPALALKLVRMSPVPLSPVVQVCQDAPGGEWVDVSLQPDFDFDFGDGCEGSVALLQLQTPGQDVEPSHLDQGKLHSQGILDMLRAWLAGGVSEESSLEGLSGSFLLGVRGSDSEAKVEVSSEFPLLTRRLNDFLAVNGQGKNWTSLRVGRNVGQVCNVEAGEELAAPVWLVTLGSFRGGGLWVQSRDDGGPVLRDFSSGGCFSGDIWDVRGSPLEVAAGCRRCLDPWVGDELWVMKAFTHSRFSELHVDEMGSLVDWGSEMVAELLELPPSNRFRVLLGGNLRTPRGKDVRFLEFGV